MQKTRILVVDDDQEICTLTKNFLDRRDYDTLIACNGKQALEILLKERPAVVLLDVRLGSESGMDILRQIRQVDQKVHVIMVTGLDDEASIREAKSLGANDYITKPFTTAYLNDFIMQKIKNLNPNV